MKRAVTIVPVLALSCCLFGACRSESRIAETTQAVIFDTDMGNDIDDALALQMLLRYDSQGVIDLRGITVSKCNPHAVEFVDGFCRFNGKDSVPLGFAYNGVNPEDFFYLLPTLNAQYNGKPLLDVRRSVDSGIPEGYKALRKWLSEAKDSSVTLIATGPLTNIANLLNSAPDEFSRLDGMALVKRKVRSLHLMSGRFDVDVPEWNVLQDISAARLVYDRCPVPIVTSGFEVGGRIRYPHESILNDFGDPASNPLCVAYMAYMQMPYDRECWDLTTVLDAIESEAGYFDHSPKGTISIDPDGVSRFVPSPDGNHVYLLAKNPDVTQLALVQRVSGKRFTGSGTALLSPSGRTRVMVKRANEAISYDLYRDGKMLFGSEPLSLFVDGDSSWDGTGSLLGTERRAVTDTVEFGVARKYPRCVESYNSMSLDFGKYIVEFRAYDSGVAYRFVGRSEAFGKVNEKGGYVFPEDFRSYAALTGNLQNWFEENYTAAPLSELDKAKFAIPPVLVDAGGTKLLFADADTYHYAGTYLRPTGKGFDFVFANYPAREELFEWGNKLYVTEREDYIVETELNRPFPWRVVGVFDNEADILEDELIYLLSRKSEEDFSWVKAGKVLWDWWNDRNVTGVDFVAGINTATYKYLIDYAAEHKIEYVLLDEGWSGRDDLLKLNPDVDIPSICAYAEDKEVGVCLWVKWINLDRQMTEALDAMEKWGVKGIKIDFMDRNDARMVDFYERVARECASRHMLVDFHGSYPNEGMRAMYPNLMTREGVVGLEYNKMRAGKDTPEHELLIPFIRQWVGPMDFTPGAMLNAQPEYHRVIAGEPMSVGTRAHQLAMYVVYESPLQMVSDSPSKYDMYPESFSFIEEVPSVWDETRCLFGELGRKLAIARRSGDRWFVGVMLAGEGESLQLPLSFLGKGQWKMTSWNDGLNASRNAKDCFVSHAEVNLDSVVEVRLERNGGWAAIFSR